MKRFFTILISLLVVLACFELQGITRTSLRAVNSAYASSSDEPPLYLPDESRVRLITFGYNNFVSDIIWFHTLNYFGKQYLGEKDYRWFHSMCRLVTNLTPEAHHVYQFCGTLLSWEARDVKASNDILTQAIINHPDDWYYYYLRGFNHWYFSHNRESARDDFLHASKLPDAPPFLASIASRLLIDQDNPQDAVNLLRQVLNQTDDPSAKQALEEKLNRALLSRDLWVYRTAIERYREAFGDNPQSLERLVEANILKGLPREPFGGEYLYIAETGEVTTSSGQKPLSFTGNTASDHTTNQEGES